MSTKYTLSQQNVIDIRGKNMLVSASAGTGKTTVMIERIASLIKEGLDVSQIVVVTFTNLSAGEMKSRLATKLNDYATDPRVRDQLERLDNSAICTLHSFCSELLRNYFYVVDIDPTFSILDNVTVNALKKSALDDMFKEYFHQKDQQFKKLYKIFATNRKEENFKSTILDLHTFSRNTVNFEGWYAHTKANMQTHDDKNGVAVTLLGDIHTNVKFAVGVFEDIYRRCADEGLEQIAQLCQDNASQLKAVLTDSLGEALQNLGKVNVPSLPRKNKKTSAGIDEQVEDKIRADYKEVASVFEKFAQGYNNTAHGADILTLWQELDFSVEICDKLVEMVCRFEKDFFALKKQRGGLDFNDLEHLALQVLTNAEALAEIKARYTMIFVDEYQDTNPVQEAIIAALSQGDNLFMVGDVKQSIYGFRGCEPGIFIEKYNQFKSTKCGHVEELNQNFRSNQDILRFVNVVFNHLMTEKFGKVDYKSNAQLQGATPSTLKTPSVKVDFLLKAEKENPPITDIYDITTPVEQGEGITQADLVCDRIKQYVGMAYKDKDGKPRRIEYGDIVILMRSLTRKATDIYNKLIENRIPVTANFKVDGMQSKEVRELVNLLRVIDNPYDDVYIVGVCLSCFGGFCESELAEIRLDTDGRVPFYDRLLQYAQKFDNVICEKITKLCNLIDSLRFYSRGASVCEVVLQTINLTNYHLHVMGLPNGALRYRKLNAFVDGLKEATYAQSIDKFLSFIDQSEEAKSEEGIAQTNAVRLMTMHGSKGLEFPVVIVAGCESQFVFDERAVERNLDLGLATKYYDFSTMKKYPTLASLACGLFSKTKQREEEMRLFYVALTRAKFALNVISTVSPKALQSLPKLPTNATSHLDWLLYALRNEYPDLDQQNEQLEINVVDCLSQRDTAEQNLLCEQSTDKDQILQQLSYRYPFEAQTQMPLKVVSSALDKMFIEQEQREPNPVIVQNDQNLLGTAYHTVYQYVDYNADIFQIEQTVQGLVADGKIDGQIAKKIDRDLVFATLQNPDLRKILASGKVYHEIPFMLYAPYDQLSVDKRFSDEVMLQGVIDLLVVGEKTATVVDFKYTKYSDTVEKRYPYQLNSYKLAVQRICGIDEVTCYVLSIADNKLIKM